jgi:hypothetical protein
VVGFVEQEEVEPGRDGHGPEGRVDSHPAGVLDGQRGHPLNQSLAAGPVTSEHLVDGQGGPGGPGRIVLRPVAAEGGRFLPDDPVDAVEEDRLVAREVREVFPRRPLPGGRAPVQVPGRRAGGNGPQRLRLGLQPDPERLHPHRVLDGPDDLVRRQRQPLEGRLVEGPPGLVQQAEGASRDRPGPERCRGHGAEPLLLQTLPQPG